jgi:hypothetical protein
MADRTPDEAFSQQLIKVGLVTDAQIKDALKAQADGAMKGETVSLGDILVEQGLLTATQRENIEKKIETQREEAKRLGPYRVLKKLGEGGMGAVYLAECAETGEKVALKVLPKVAAKDQDAVRRFLREVESARRLEHPNIVRAGAAGEDKGFHYYVMEYVEGETLGARLKREGALLPGEATTLILQVARGLKYAHGLGFIHRDIKPDNVIVAREGAANILDMGLSKNIDEAQTFRTITGVSLGTPHYIAPEQARGDKGIDGRADIYSLGATYYHLVTGETPFHGTTAIELISQHLHKQIPDPRDVRDGIPDGVIHIIRRMMAKKPQDRYRDCGELIVDLELVLGGGNPSSRELDAARSAVALPMSREARERYRARLLQRPPGATRATTAPQPARVPIWAWAAGGAAALVLLLALALKMGGGSPEGRGSTPARNTTVNEGRGSTPAPENPDPLPPKSPSEIRFAEAQAKLDNIKDLERAGRLDAADLRRRYREFAREYANTAQGRTIAEWLDASEAERLKSPEPKSVPPKGTEPPAIAPSHLGGPQGPCVGEAPRPEEPKPVDPAPPAPKPPELAQSEKPPEPAPAPPTPDRSETRKPVPDAAKLRDAEAALRKVFKIEGAKTPAEKAALPRELLQTAATSGAKDAELYVFLRAYLKRVQSRRLQRLRRFPFRIGSKQRARPRRGGGGREDGAGRHRGAGGGVRDRRHPGEDQHPDEGAGAWAGRGGLGETMPGSLPAGGRGAGLRRGVEARVECRGAGEVGEGRGADRRREGPIEGTAGAQA